MEPSGVTLSPTRRLVVAALIALVAACQSSATTAPSAGVGPPGPTGGASGPLATPSATAGASALFHVVGSAPVIPRTIVPNRTAILPGAVTAAEDGTYHAWIVAFTGAPGTQDIHYLASPDAVTWSEVGDASLAGLSEGFADPGALPTSVLETPDGWVMYAVASLAGEREGWDIWRATAPSAAGPWTRDAEPVLRRGPAGAWDAGGLDFPTAIATDDGFAIFYSGIPTIQRATGSIGLATSVDGIAWTKHDDPATAAELGESDPVAGPGLCGGFDARATHQPRVVAAADGLYMVYAGYAGSVNARPGVGLATSLDAGVSWTCQWRANALRLDELPAGEGVHTVNAFMRGDRLSLLVEWLRTGGTDVWLAHLGPREP